MVFLHPDCDQRHDARAKNRPDQTTPAVASTREEFLTHDVEGRDVEERPCSHRFEPCHRGTVSRSQQILPKKFSRRSRNEVIN